MNPGLDSIRAVADTLDHAGVGVCVFDAQDRAVLWNASLFRCLPFHAPMLHAGELLPEAMAQALRGASTASLDFGGELESMEFAVMELPGQQRFSAWRAPVPEARPDTVAALLQANQQLQLLALTDPLTEIGNRRALDHQLAAECRRARRSNAPMAMLLLDLDHFKDLNDSRGHAAGDSALAAMGAMLQRLCRRPGDHCARQGGDEFALVLPGATAEGALGIAEDVRAELERWAAKARLGVTVSIGVAAQQAPVEPAQLMAAADRALYEAKARGRNRVVLAGGARQPDPQAQLQDS